MNCPVVKIIAQELVVPSGEAPSGNLPFSFMDKTPGSTGLVDSIHVFSHGEEPAKVIKEALAKTLVFYYPVAGRFAKSDKGELEIVCTGDGVWFVEAAASCRLEDVGHLQLPLMMAKEDLLPYPTANDMEKLQGIMKMMQVTQFACGGFVVGIRSSHALFDGIGAAQFVQAVATMAKGSDEPAVTPIWCRDAIPDPPKIRRGLPPPLLQTFDFENFTMDVSIDQINRVKQQFLMETGKVCSKFDVLTAKIWQSRVRAINSTVEPHVDVHLGFAANTRHLLRELLPQEGSGYYGNCAYPVTVTAPCGRVMDGSLVEVINMIRDVKAQLPTKFSKLLRGELEDDPFGMPIDYGFMTVSDWSRVGFSEIDYGWGEPLHVCPVNDFNIIASCVFLRQPPPKQGVRLIARCVLKHELDTFRDEMMGLSTHQCTPADKVDDALSNS